MINLSKLIDLSYLLDPNPPYQFSAFRPLLVLFSGVIILALVIPFYRWQPWQAKYKDRLATPLWILGLGGLTLLLSRNQSIPYLSTRALFLLLVLASLLWIGYSLTVTRREVTKEKLEYSRAKRLEKYLPRPKH